MIRRTFVLSTCLWSVCACERPTSDPVNEVSAAVSGPGLTLYAHPPFFEVRDVLSLSDSAVVADPARLVARAARSETVPIAFTIVADREIPHIRADVPPLTAVDATATLPAVDLRVVKLHAVHGREGTIDRDYSVLVPGPIVADDETQLAGGWAPAGAYIEDQAGRSGGAYRFLDDVAELPFTVVEAAHELTFDMVVRPAERSAATEPGSGTMIRYLFEASFDEGAGIEKRVSLYYAHRDDGTWPIMYQTYRLYDQGTAVGRPVYCSTNYGERDRFFNDQGWTRLSLVWSSDADASKVSLRLFKDGSDVNFSCEYGADIGEVLDTGDRRYAEPIAAGPGIVTLARSEGPDAVDVAFDYFRVHAHDISASWSTPPASAFVAGLELDESGCLTHSEFAFCTARDTPNAGCRDALNAACASLRSSAYRPPVLHTDLRTSLHRSMPKTFWLTAQVPKDAVAGRYQTVATLKAGGMAVARVPIVVDVLPFILDAPAATYGTYYSPRLPTDGSVAELARDLDDLRAHGLSGIELHDVQRNGDFSAVDAIVSTDLRGPVITRSFDAGQFEALEARGLTSYVYGIDEFHREGATAQHVARVEAIRDYAQANGIPTPPVATSVTRAHLASIEAGAVDIGPFTSAAEIVNMPIYHASYLPRCSDRGDESLRSYIDAYRADPAAKNPRYEREFIYFQYWYEYPLLNRVMAGYFLATTPFDGLWPFTYREDPQFRRFGDPYIDSDNGVLKPDDTRDMQVVFPSASGPISSMKWEGLAAGIVDGRYVQTLRRAITRAWSRSPSPRLRAIRSELDARLAAFEDPRYFDKRACDGVPVGKCKLLTIENDECAGHSRALTALDYEDLRQWIAGRVVEIQGI